MRANLVSFLKFLTGRNQGGSGRLAIYDEYTEMGRKDVYVSNISNNAFYREDEFGNEAICEFSVKFRVCDPVTEVGPNNLANVTELIWPYDRPED